MDPEPLTNEQIMKAEVGPELNALVAKHVFGLEERPCTTNHCHGTHWFDPVTGQRLYWEAPNFSGGPLWAFDVLHHLRVRRIYVALIPVSGAGWMATNRNPVDHSLWGGLEQEDQPSVQWTAEFASEAISRVALALVRPNTGGEDGTI